MIPVKGFLLKIAGCRVALGTDFTADAASADPLWWDGDVAEGWLEWPDITWTERAKPLDGDLDVSGITLKIRDGEVDGAPLATTLFTIDTRAQVSSPLAASIDESDLFVTVANGTLFTIDTYVWCERECMLVVDIVGNVLEVERGKFGTRTLPHVVDDRANRRPEVFTTPPWLGVQRHAFLWAVLDDDTTMLLYIGLTQRPSLGNDGASIELPIEHLWTILRTQRVGQYYGSAELVGVGAPVPGFVVDLSVSTSNADVPVSRAKNPSPKYRTLLEPLIETAAGLGREVITRGGTGGTGWARDNGDGTATAQAQWSGTLLPRGGKASILGASPDAAVDGQLFDNGTTRAVRWTIPLMPCGYIFVSSWGGATPHSMYVRSLLSLPTTWEGSDVTDSGRTTRASRVLRATGKDVQTDGDSEWYVVLNDVVVDTGETSITATPTMRRKKADQAGGAFGGIVIVTEPALEVVLQVSCDHWADGWRYGIIPELTRDTWDDQWDWTSLDALARAAPGALGRRTEYYDAQVEVGELLTNDCLLAGATPVVRAGRMALWAWQIPLATTPSVATYTAVDILDEVTPWGQWDEGLANSFAVKASSVNIQVTDSRSIDRYGKGRDISVDLKSIDADAVRALDPIAVKNAVLRRLLLWSEPIAMVPLQVPFGAVYVGDVITVTEWVAPDGAGGRGLSSVRMVVVAREPNLGDGTMKLHCLLFGREAFGYSPAARVDTYDSDDAVLLANNAFDGSVGYDGVAGYSRADFAVGMVVELIQRDTATPLTQELEIASLPALDAVVFTTTLDPAIITALDGGAWFDMRFTRFANATALQRALYAWVGSIATNTIDGTDVEAQRIAP